jgi:hypothetical protein
MNGCPESLMLEDAPSVSPIISIEIAKREKHNEYMRKWYANHKEKWNKRSREYYASNKEKINKYRANNRESILAAKRKYNEEHRAENILKKREYYSLHRKECIAKTIERNTKNKNHINLMARKRHEKDPSKKASANKKYREKHPLIVKAKGKEWVSKNKDKSLAIKAKYRHKIRSTPKGKLNQRMSAGINVSLRGNKTGRKWESLTGYTVDQLRNHLEKQFKDGMSWGKFMVGEIHIDHIIPISAFNYEKPEDDDFKRCWDLKNLQPLWKLDNLIKHNKIEKPFQPSLVFGTFDGRMYGGVI